MGARTIGDKQEVDSIQEAIRGFLEDRAECGIISDFSGCFSEGFFSTLVELCKSTNDHLLYVSVLSPDPISYFFANFKEYPIIEFSTSTSEDEFFSRLSCGPLGSPADAITYNSEVIFIFPASRRWYINADRNLDTVQHCIINKEI